MKGREGKGPPSTDLLVCFPSRAHLTLMPKPICSPARPLESSKRHHNHQHNNGHHHHHHFKKSSYRAGAVGQASPLLWAKTNKPISKDISEPTSPKVTCAGQIKVRSKPASSCKDWQSVMEEIERLHKNRKQKKKSAWVEALGFKKEVMQFLTCLRNIRFDFRCFGSFPTSGITSDEDDDEDEEDEDYHKGPRRSREVVISDDNETSRTVFSKWFMVLQENSKDLMKKGKEKSNNIEESIEAPCAPPPNALLLMRCRSAPAKSWLEERQEVEEEEEEEESSDDEDEKQQKEEEEKLKNAKQEMEEEKRRKENLVVMRCGTADFYKFSSDIAKETWVVGGTRDSLARSRSWKR